MPTGNDDPFVGFPFTDNGRFYIRDPGTVRRLAVLHAFNGHGNAVGHFLFQIYI